MNVLDSQAGIRGFVALEKHFLTMTSVQSSFRRRMGMTPIRVMGEADQRRGAGGVTGGLGRAARPTSSAHAGTNRIQYHYSELLYAHRHVVENFFARIKRFRRVGTRYEKLSVTFLGFVTLATILDWLHFEV